MASKLKKVFGGLLRSLHQLWLEVTGTFLLVFGGVFGFYAVKEFTNLDGSPDSTWSIVTAAGLSLLTLGFGIHSLWKSRKLR